jgi:hypothetical protein
VDPLPKTALIVTLLVAALPVSGRSEERLTIKVANLADWVMESHLDRGENRRDDSDDSFPLLEGLLDAGLKNEKGVGGPKDGITEFMLAERKVKASPADVLSALGVDGTELEERQSPSPSEAWEAVGFKKESPSRFWTLELGGGHHAIRQKLAFIALKSPEGAFEKVPFWEQVGRRSSPQSAIILPRFYFQFQLERGRLKGWVEKNLTPRYGVSFIILKSDTDYRIDSDRIVIIIDDQKLHQSGHPVELKIAFGWRDKEIKDPLGRPRDGGQRFKGGLSF